MIREFSAFLVVGAVAAGANWSSNVALRVFLPLQYSIVLAYLIGLTVAYFLCRKHVFYRSDLRMRRGYTRFAVVNAVALLQVWGVTIGLVDFVFPMIDWNWQPEELGHALGVASPTITSYLGHKYYTFSQDL